MIVDEMEKVWCGNPNYEVGKLMAKEEFKSHTCVVLDRAKKEARGIVTITQPVREQQKTDS
jgi:hypothetical protein